MFSSPKSLLNFSQPTPTYPFIFENSHGFMLPSHFKAEQLHFSHISFSEGLQTNTEADTSSSSITYFKGIFQSMSIKAPEKKKRAFCHLHTESNDLQGTIDKASLFSHDRNVNI